MRAVPETDDLLAALDPEQRAVATTFGVPVCVIAGAGTGKTRAITHRIAHGCAIGAYDPLAVLAVTFTTRAAGELRGRLRGLGQPRVQARTFHSAALRQAQYFWPAAMGGELPRVSDQRAGTGRAQLGAIFADRTVLYPHVVTAPGVKPLQAAAEVRGDLEIYVPLAGIVDLAEERTRIQKEITKAENELVGLKKRRRERCICP